MTALKKITIATVVLTFLALSPDGKASDIKKYQEISYEWDCTPMGQGETEFAKRCLEVAEKYPNTPDEMAALYLAACRASKTEPGQKARELLIARIATADLGQLAEAIRYTTSPAPYEPNDKPPDWRYYPMQPDEAIIVALLNRLKRHPSDPHTASLLTRVCVLSRGKDAASPTASFAEAAGLIASQHAASPDIVNFCEILGGLGGTPQWAVQYEPHLRTILESNQSRHIRVGAQFALASVAQSSGASRQDEAKGLFTSLLESFDGQLTYHYQSIEKELRKLAQWRLAGMNYCGIGKPAPEIVGTDLDGQPMKLSDYRGKVVLLSFWATWCAPCMKLIPHERQIAKHFQDKPFSIVGVNGDSDETAIKKAVTTHEITWRSFHDKRADGKTISDRWKIVGWPELYLIDHQGIIREKWLDTPTPEKLDQAIDQLVKSIR